MNKSTNNKEIALKWIDAFCKHDLEYLLELYAETAIHFSPKLKARQPETNGWIRGKAALKTWWADAFNRLPSLQYELQNLIIDDTQVLMEYKRRVDGEPDMMIAEVLEIKEGLIVQSRVYHG
jgi:ketosteroid isomerase-like protein